MSLRQRLRHYRSAYIRDPSTARLRVYLRVKARAGIYDERMLSGRFTGIGRDLPNRICPAARRAVVRAVAANLVPTDTLRPVGSSGSYHAQRNGTGEGLGIDLGNYPGYRPGEARWSRGRERLETFQRKELWRYRHGKISGMMELIGPDNRMIVLRGAETDLREGIALEDQHDNHVHEGYSS